MGGKYLKNKPVTAIKPTNKKKKWKVVVLSIFLLLIVLICGVVAFFWSKLDLIEYDNEVNYDVYRETTSQQITDSEQTGEMSGTDQEPQEEQVQEEAEDNIDISGLEMVETAPVIPESEVFEDANVLNILVIGTDERTKNFDTNARSDCMILVSIDRERNTVKLVSLERGIAAPILEGMYAGGHDWLTHIFRYGGAELLRKTVEHCFKVDVDHYVRFNFTSVTNVIDAIGGVDINLTNREAMGLNGQIATNARTKHPMKEGVNHVDGYDALQYARIRYIDSDWQRIERQRKLILAVVDALKNANLLELNNLANTVLPMVQTNLSKLEIAELVLYAPNFLKSEFDQMTIPKEGTYGGMGCIQGRGGFAVDYEINNDLLHRFLYEGATSEELLAE